ncbi:MAG: tRNA (adenosine(37)-N6)-threonylcarbamoyltransferase complex dimerization subunit type 1 TsaB [Propionibacteriaceae bacterium]|jgi:tRNA threonylcarbamoyl adenosine modification protein YeaZ|nr:tRNA (adenosine(37)-N6)-threonylcarbamoyltransferase complex dimerization subunit type 1 TsaB [Propionibacteriaceae bacterium]
MSDIVLGIDTSTQVCVGLARDGEVLVSQVIGDTRSHAELVQPTIVDVLARAGLTPADLTGIAVGMGPGPFTGLRVGIAAAGVMAQVLGIELKRVCSLDVIGLQHCLLHDGFVSQPFIAATDARRKELYWAAYDVYGHRTDGPFVSPPDSLPDLLVVGPGAGVHGFARPSESDAVPSGQATTSLTLDAGFLAAHARDLDDVGPEPLYLRHADATPNITVKSALTPSERSA